AILPSTRSTKYRHLRGRRHRPARPTHRRHDRQLSRLRLGGGLVNKNLLHGLTEMGLRSSAQNNVIRFEDG
ncbi:unnamed protein product, partial [Musa banksii]